MRHFSCQSPTFHDCARFPAQIIALPQPYQSYLTENSQSLMPPLHPADPSTKCSLPRTSAHSCQVQLYAYPHQPLTTGQGPLLFGVRRDLIRVTDRKCTMPATQIWHPTPLTAPSQRLHPAQPRAAKPATSPNSAAPLAAPQSALAAGIDTPQPAALCNCQLCVSRA